jgi:hypothetical protein
VNFTVPASGLANGDVSITFETDEALNEMATISLSGFPNASAQMSPHSRASRLRSRGFAHGATRDRRAKHRRPLPDNRIR